MPDVNTPLLRKVLEHVIAHPEEWDQSEYGKRTACGTAYCVAGHAVVMSGYDLLFNDRGQAMNMLDDRAESPKYVSREAEKALGLSWAQGLELFDEDNTMRQIFTLANCYTDGEIEIPATLPDGS